LLFLYKTILFLFARNHCDRGEGEKTIIRYKYNNSIYLYYTNINIYYWGGADETKSLRSILYGRRLRTIFIIVIIIIIIIIKIYSSIYRFYCPAATAQSWHEVRPRFTNIIYSPPSGVFYIILWRIILLYDHRRRRRSRHGIRTIIILSQGIVFQTIFLFAWKTLDRLLFPGTATVLWFRTDHCCTTLDLYMSSVGSLVI